MPDLYKLPFRPGAILKRRSLATCDQRRSIAQNLHLLLCTREGEYKFDPSYGCPIWENDYDNAPSTGLWRETMSKALRDRIERYELRLEQPRVTVNLIQEQTPAAPGRKPSFKRKMEVTIEAQLAQTREAFRFTSKIYISPFSYD